MGSPDFAEVAAPLGLCEGVLQVAPTFAPCSDRSTRGTVKAVRASPHSLRGAIWRKIRDSSGLRKNLLPLTQASVSPIDYT